ncbi:hypothetical protein HGRIS_012133 [Hohenbuehelia grisea]|uniref:Galactose oxidase n=1 Tax=Hohenbuehelia grisea TaxID=104357 RepID=A0ABR3IRB7_9AGAR
MVTSPRARVSNASNTTSESQAGSSSQGSASGSKRRGRRSRRVHTSVKPEPGLEHQDLDTTNHKLAFTGDLPPYNDWSKFIVDHERSHLYVYGGTRPGDILNTPTNDLYRCDMNTLVWTNLTNSVRLFFPSGSADADAIPVRAHAAATFMKHDNCRYLVLFGGFSPKESCISPTLVFLDVDSLVWTLVTPKPLPAPEPLELQGRIHAAIVAVRNQIFIFGGISKFEGEPLRTFCVAELQAGVWSWVIYNREYPPEVPDLGVYTIATSVYNGANILLTMGRPSTRERISLSANTSVLFHTTHHEFQCESSTRGEFPKGAGWYEICSLSRGLPCRPLAPPPTPPKPRGRPPRKPVLRPQTSEHRPLVLPAPPLAHHPPFAERAIICAWVPIAEGSDFVPDFWLYTLPPVKEVCCLNVREYIMDLDLRLEAFVVVGERIFMLGFDGPEDDSQSDGPNAEGVYNMCVEVRFEDLEA